MIERNGNSMRMENIEQFMSTKVGYFELKMTDTNLLVLTGCCDLEAIAQAILATKPLYINGDTRVYKGKDYSLVNSQITEHRNNLTRAGIPQLCQTDSGDGAQLVAKVLENSPDDRALLEDYVKAASARFGMPCKHGETIKPPNTRLEDAIIEIDAAVLSPARLVSAYHPMKGQVIPFICIPGFSGQSGKLEPGFTSRLDASAGLKNTTTVMMTATAQSPSDEATMGDQRQTSSSDGFGSIDIDELWVPGGFDEKFKPIAGFDLATKLEEMGALAGAPKIADVFTYYPVKECPFDAKHRRVVLSQHRSGTITYLCPHHSCKGKKKGFDRKTARDYFNYYGVGDSEVIG
jgi:hypothetical protein